MTAPALMTLVPIALMTPVPIALMTLVLIALMTLVAIALMTLVRMALGPPHTDRPRCPPHDVKVGPELEQVRARRRAFALVVARVRNDEHCAAATRTLVALQLRALLALALLRKADQVPGSLHKRRLWQHVQGHWGAGGAALPASLQLLPSGCQPLPGGSMVRERCDLQDLCKVRVK